MKISLPCYRVIAMGLVCASLLASSWSISGAEIEHPADLHDESSIQVFEIRGVVEDSTPNLSDEAFNRLEQAIMYKPGDVVSNIPPALLDRYIRRELSIPLTAQVIVTLLEGETLNDEDRQALLRMQERVKDYLAKWEGLSLAERGEFLALHKYGDVLEDMFSSKPAENTIVTLRGIGIEEKAQTDEKGEYQFVGFAEGHYELSARTESRRNSESQAWGKVEVNFIPGRRVRIVINDYALILRGRVVTDAGEPVIGARVNLDRAFARDVLRGTKVREVRRTEEMQMIYRRTAVTDTNGVFEVSGVPPPDIEMVWRYIAGGLEGALSEFATQADGLTDLVADISVQAEGHVPPDVLRLPLVPESLVGPARTLWRLKVRTTSDLTENERKEYVFEDRGQLPKSEGSTIFCPDIVISKLNAPSKPKTPLAHEVE